MSENESLKCPKHQLCVLTAQYNQFQKRYDQKGTNVDTNLKKKKKTYPAK